MPWYFPLCHITAEMKISPLLIFALKMNAQTEIRIKGEKIKNTTSLMNVEKGREK